jgi:hypothetical protein
MDGETLKAIMRENSFFRGLRGRSAQANDVLFGRNLPPLAWPGQGARWSAEVSMGCCTQYESAASHDNH